ncbi:MAG: hypothetical protein AAF907_07355, partial [Planctomycetota bacterium]
MSEPATAAGGTTGRGRAGAARPAAVGEPGTTVLQDPAATPAVEEWQPGDRIDEFLLLRRLGRGAFATVYLARQLTAQRLVALKVGRPDDRELVHLAQLDHPGVVRVYDRRKVAGTDKQFLYLEYVPGGTLEAAIRAAHAGGAGPDGRRFLKA